MTSTPIPYFAAKSFKKVTSVDIPLSSIIPTGLRYTLSATEAKLKDYSLDSYPRKSSPLEELFKQTEEDEIAARVISKKVGKENYELFQKITNPKLNNGVQMALPYQITIK